MSRQFKWNLMRKVALGAAAIALMARREGILLDPVYTGKAFAGLIDMARSNEISGRVLFWHTGGFPTLLAGPRV